jgi:N-acetylglutamate synthase-like GNAT family acetyltransferase
MAQLLSVEAYRVRKSMFPFLDEEFDPSILWEEEKIAEETVKSGVETLTEKPTIVKERRISLSELKEGPNCLRNFIPDWQRYNWVILFDIPRSALPSGLIAELLRKWSDSGWTVINIEKSGKFVIRGSVLVCTRSNYPSRYEELIKPSSTDPYVKRLLDNVDPEIVKIIITTKEIYRLKEVKESLDRCGFIDVEVTTAEEEKSAWEKLYEKSGSVFIADRYAEAAVLLPWLITKCGKNGLDLDGIKKLLDERAKKGIIEESDAETLYQIISEGVSPTPEFQDYKPVAISLGILKEAKRKDGEE